MRSPNSCQWFISLASRTVTFFVSDHLGETACRGGALLSAGDGGVESIRNVSILWSQGVLGSVDKRSVGAVPGKIG